MNVFSGHLRLLIAGLVFFVVVWRSMLIVDVRTLKENTPYPSSVSSGKLLILSYVWGSVNADQFNTFARSLREVSPAADVVVLYKKGTFISEIVSQTALLANVNLVQFPLEDYDGNPIIKRFFFWHQYIKQIPNSQYTHIANTDLDVIFQRDLLSCIGDIAGLHVFEETKAELLHECSHHKKWYYECKLKLKDGRVLDGGELFEEQTSFRPGRICAGFTSGDRASMLTFLDHMAFALEDGVCNDQGVQNMLVWGKFLLPAIPNITIFDQVSGPLKNIDIGYITDAWGRVYNDKGQMYCVMHQYKDDRNPDFAGFMHGRYPIFQRFFKEPTSNIEQEPQASLGRRVVVEDHLFPDKVHRLISVTGERNITSAGPLANVTRVPKLTATDVKWGFRQAWRQRVALDRLEHESDPPVYFGF